MTTKDSVTQNEKGSVTEFQALAVTLSNSNKVTVPSAKELYELATGQMTVIQTDMEMPELPNRELAEPKVLVNITGQDSQLSDWAVRVVPQRSELDDYTAQEERDELLAIVREATHDLMHGDLCKTTAFFSHHAGFMGTIEMVAPIEYAKLSHDFSLAFHPINDESKKMYKRSKPLNEDAVRLVLFPEWVNEEWLYWKSGTAGQENFEQLEPPRIMMIYDVESNTAFLLGARCFLEVKKAAISIIGNMAVRQKLGLPLNGASQSFNVLQGGKLHQTNFSMVGLSGTGKSTIASCVHETHLKSSKKESVEIGGDDSLVMMVGNINGRKMGLLSLESAYFHTTADLKAKSSAKKQILSAENVMVSRDEKDKKILIYQNALDEAGRVLLKPSTEDGMIAHLNLPDYFVMLTHDTLLPPVMLIKDTSLMKAMFLSYGSETDEGYRFEPAANPHTLWSLDEELSLFEKAYVKTKFKMLILNTASFYRTDKNSADIPKEISSGILLRIAKGELKWKDWSATMPGFFLPDKNSLKNLRKDYDTLYDPEKIKDKEKYQARLRERVEQRLTYLQQLGAAHSLLTPFYRILSKLP
ncbi:phosphoenolpyruvate carboxykinase (ATP) [bacterium]|nr:phosphoenolpyruvate carboxykinase (ATP) [bacterium]